MELLINLHRLERLDKPEYTDDERQEAEEMYEQRRQEELANDVRNWILILVDLLCILILESC